ncbi:helicase associated domain-containing protein [Pontibacter toksunensis]|uniref:Helicase associated domain-containing protein n=1 Tax=Pontibacter toksunensis TaxID=1332631 RepID=A0ABW6BYT8_9BACT
MENVAKELLSKESLDKWYSNYHKLEYFKKQTEPLLSEFDESLTRWADAQRSMRHVLPGELKKKLAALRFNFKSREVSWEFMYRQLAGFVEENGHTCLPSDQKFEALQDWLNRQIFNKRLLSATQFQQLDSLGVDWDALNSRDQRWELMYLRLQEFYRLYGHCRVPQKWEKDRQLAQWVSVQRRVYSKNKLSEAREHKLNELGFVWNIKTVFDAQWEQYFQEMAVFYHTHGHCRVPGKYEKLASWVERQRTAKVNNLLPADRERRLGEINFIWNCVNIKKKGWEKKYRQLCTYKQKYGHSFVPVNCRENKALGTWVATQRLLESRGKLGAAKKRMLSEIGFVWGSDTQRQLKSGYDAQWEASFEKLKAYKQQYGTCQVSLKIDPALQRWTRWQRMLFNQGRLSAARTNRLNEIHFPWSVQEEYWMRMFEALVEFRNQYGHTSLPHQWAPNPPLAAWVYRVRRDKLKLSTRKVKLLNGIGFDWTLSRRTIVPWKEMYKRLKAFKREHGHTCVPVKWNVDPKLGRWVSRMRYERDKLSAERVSLLNAIAFDWRVKPASSNTAAIHA